MTISRPSRAAARSALAAVIGVACASALLSIVFAALWLTDVLAREFHAEVPVVSPPGLLPYVTGAAGESSVAYSTVTLSSWDALPGPRAQLALSIGAYFALFVASCIVVILLAVRLWHHRPLARMATASVVALGVFATVVAFVGPWLRMSAVSTAVIDLGYPVSGEAEGAHEWLVPPTFAVQDADWLLLTFGMLLVLTAGLLAAGRRAQRDVEGLV